MAVLLNFSLLQNPPTRSYAYDSLYRLTGVTDASAAVLEGYTYNATGDRLSKTYQGSTDTYGYTDPLTSHRLQAVSGVGRDYDANGNTTQSNGNTFAYDDRNRMIQAGGWSYAYNGRGERVLKQLPGPWNEGDLNVGSMFAYSSAGQMESEYSFTTQCLGPSTPSGCHAGARWWADKDYIWADGVLVGVAVVGDSIYYVETDQLGTPRSVILPGETAESDTVVWKWDYFGNAFGEDYPDEDPDGDGESFTFNLRFPGQYFDAETGLSYNLNRDYESATGRYIESDPIGIDGGINTYGYAIESPLVYSDRWGLSSECTECDAQNSGANSGRGGGDDPGPEPGLEGVYPELFIIPLARAGSLAGAARSGGAALLNKCKNIRCKLPEIHDDHHTFGWPFNRKMCHLQLNCWIKGIKGSQFTIRIPFPCDGGGIPGFKDQR